MRPSYCEELPRFIEPMLATSAPTPAGEGWAMEVKWDGMRAQLRYDGRRVSVRSRAGRNCTEEFPELAAIAEQMGDRRVILDGELVCLGDDGKPDFAVLRKRLGRQPGRRSGRVPTATLMIFDGLHLDGRAIRRVPYAARRELLESLRLEGPVWRTPRHFVDESAQLLRVTADLRLEGVVAKRLDAPYREGRSRSWIKHTHRHRERLAVTGWRQRSGRGLEFLLARAGPNGLRPARERVVRARCGGAGRAARGTRGARTPHPLTARPNALGGSRGRGSGRRTRLTDGTRPGRNRPGIRCGMTSEPAWMSF